MATLPENAKDIGGNWVETTDPTTGRVYYANTVSQATSWVWPEDLPKPEGAAPDWTAAQDPDTQRTYYMNRVTGVTAWEKPEGYVEPATPAVVAQAPAAAAAVTPEVADATPTPAAAPGATPPATPTAAAARKTWRASLDPGSGNTYYTSDKGDTTWEKPADYVAPEVRVVAAPSFSDDVSPLAVKKSAGFVGFAEEPVKSEKPSKKAGFSVLEDDEAGSTRFSTSGIANEIDADNWSSKTAKRKTHLYAASNSVLSCVSISHALICVVISATLLQCVKL